MRLFGKPIAESLCEQLRRDLPKGVHLTVVLVGDNPASQVYVQKKHEACATLGIGSQILRLPKTIKESDLLAQIRALNEDPKTHGILVQLPLPASISTERILSSIHPLKDVDGLHPENIGLLQSGSPRFIPCTPKGVMSLLAHIGFSCVGKNAVVLGRSQIVGRPMAALLLNQSATVTICHSKTVSPESICKTADLIVAAVGVPGLVKASWIKPGACVIDVGINRMDGKLVGDVDTDAVADLAAYVTPVPGGVGPLTIVSLLENTVQAFRLQHT